MNSGNVNPILIPFVSYFYGKNLDKKSTKMHESFQ